MCRKNTINIYMENNGIKGAGCREDAGSYVDASINVTLRTAGSCVKSIEKP